MRPIIVGIGGAHSRVGKTTVACQILRRLTEWGAIKYTKTAFYSSIVDNPELVRKRDKDTGRLFHAGAQDVLWVQSPPEDLKEVLRIAVERLSHLRGIILEGNSAIEILRPDIVLFVCGGGGLKRGADTILRMADAVVFDKDLPPEIPDKTQRFSINNKEGYINFILNRITNKNSQRSD